MKLSPALLILTLCLLVLISCESEENTSNRESITFTINNDYTYTLELIDSQNDGCDFQLSVGNQFNLHNLPCDTQDNSALLFNIYSYEAIQGIQIVPHGSFAGSQLEAVLSFQIPVEDTQGNLNNVLFNMFNGNFDIINSGSINEYYDFEFTGEALSSLFLPGELIPVSCTGHVLRDQ